MHKKYRFYRRNIQKIMLLSGKYSCFVEEFILSLPETATFPLIQSRPFLYNANTFHGLTQKRGTKDEREVVASGHGGWDCGGTWKFLRLWIDNPTAYIKYHHK
jgi:hypothetical protein